MEFAKATWFLVCERRNGELGRSYKDVLRKYWNDVEPLDRLWALQRLEMEYAEKQGRRPCRIVPMEMYTRYGFYNYNNYKYKQYKPSTIYINKELINEIFIEEVNSRFFAVETVIHEGRHAFQYYAVEEKRKGRYVYDQKEVELWEKNLEQLDPPGVYYWDSYNFRFQAIERDAYTYAYTEMEKFFEPDIEYEKFLRNRLEREREWLKDAKRYYKKKTIKEIQAEIDREMISDYLKERRKELIQLIDRKKEMEIYSDDSNKKIKNRNVRKKQNDVEMER